jgi:hypothetical protein
LTSVNDGVHLNARPPNELPESVILASHPRDT